MGNSKRTKNKKGSHSLKKSYGIKTSAKNRLTNMKENGDAKSLSRLAVMRCLKSTCFVQVDNIDYVLKGRSTVSLKELPNSWSDAYQHRNFNENVSGITGDSESDDDFGLKIVETYSLAATAKHVENLSKNDNISHLAQSSGMQESVGSMNIGLVSTYHLTNRLSMDDYTTQSDHTQSKVDSSQKLLTGGESVDGKMVEQGFPLDMNEGDHGTTPTHASASDTRSVFCSSLLDDMLASENKVLESSIDCMSEPWTVDTGDLKYSTPTCQASYVKTLSTALQERREIEAKLSKPETCETERLKTNYCKSKKPTFNLSKVRTTLQQSHSSRFRRDNAITEILSGLPNMQFSKKTSRSKIRYGCTRFRSMLQDITLRKADFAASAVVDPGNIPFTDFLSKNLSKADKIKRGARLSLPNKFAQCCIVQSNPLKRFSLPSSDAPVFKRKRQEKNMMQFITKDMANMAVTAFTAYSPLSSNEACISITSDVQTWKFHTEVSQKYKRAMKKLKKKLLSLQPLSLKVAVAKYLVYKAKKQSAEKKLRDFVALHFNKLPVCCVRDKVHRRKQLKLKIAKHKLLWRIVRMNAGFVVYPDQFSAPDNAVRHEPANDAIESCTSARTRIHESILKKYSKVTLKAFKKTNGRSAASLSDFTGKSIDNGVVLLRLSCPSDNDEGTIVVKIISLCDWSMYTEEIMDLIVGCHRELAVMQRGKYLRTDVGECIFEVLREVAGRIIFDHLPVRLKSEVDVPHWKYVSLIKISPRPTKRSNNTINLDRTINFSVAIEDMLQLNKEMSKTKKTQLHSIVVNGIFRDKESGSCSANSGFELGAGTKNDIFKSSVVDKVKSSNLSKLAGNRKRKSERVVETTSSLYEIDETTRQKFEVGRIGCLNKFTARLLTQNATGPVLKPTVRFSGSRTSICSSFNQQPFVSNTDQTRSYQGVQQSVFLASRAQSELPKVSDGSDKNKSASLPNNGAGLTMGQKVSSSPTTLATFQTNPTKNIAIISSHKPSLTTYSNAPLQKFETRPLFLTPVSPSLKATPILCVPVSFKVLPKQMKPLLTHHDPAVKAHKKTVLRMSGGDVKKDYTSKSVRLEVRKEIRPLVSSPQKQPVSAPLHVNKSEKLNCPKNTKISVVAPQTCESNSKPASFEAIKPQPIVLHQVSSIPSVVLNHVPSTSTKCFVEQKNNQYFTQENGLLKSIPLGKLSYQPIAVKPSTSVSVMPCSTASSTSNLQVFSTLHGQHMHFGKPQVVSSVSTPSVSSSQLYKRIIPNTTHRSHAPILTTPLHRNQVPLKNVHVLPQVPAPQNSNISVRVKPISIVPPNLCKVSGKKSWLISCNGIKQSSAQTFTVALSPTDSSVQAQEKKSLNDSSTSAAYTSNVTITSTTSTFTNETPLTSSYQQPVLSSPLLSTTQPMAESQAFGIGSSSDQNKQPSPNDKIDTVSQLSSAVGKAYDETSCNEDSSNKAEILSTNRDDHDHIHDSQKPTFEKQTSNLHQSSSKSMQISSRLEDINCNSKPISHAEDLDDRKNSHAAQLQENTSISNEEAKLLNQSSDVFNDLEPCIKHVSNNHIVPSHSTSCDSGQSCHGGVTVCSETSCRSSYEQATLDNSLSFSSSNYGAIKPNEASTSFGASGQIVDKDSKSDKNVIVSQHVDKTSPMDNQGPHPFVHIKRELMKNTKKLIFQQSQDEDEEVIDVCHWDDEQKEMLSFLRESTITASKRSARLHFKEKEHGAQTKAAEKHGKTQNISAAWCDVLSDSNETSNPHNFNERLRRRVLRINFINLYNAMNTCKDKSKRGILEKAQKECKMLKKDEQALKEIKKILKNKHRLLQLYICHLQVSDTRDSDDNTQSAAVTLKEEIHKINRDLEVYADYLRGQQLDL